MTAPVRRHPHPTTHEGSQVWASSKGCTECEWDKLQKWVIRKKLTGAYPTPVEVSHAITNYVDRLEAKVRTIL